MRLFHVAKKVRWLGSRALVAVPAESCPSCAGSGSVEAVTERDLLYPDMTAFGVPLMECEACGGEGTVLA